MSTNIRNEIKAQIVREGMTMQETVAMLDRIPPEIINVYARTPAERRSKVHEEVL